MGNLDIHNARQAINKAIAELQSAEYYLANHGVEVGPQHYRLETEIKHLNALSTSLSYFAHYPDEKEP